MVRDLSNNNELILEAKNVTKQFKVSKKNIVDTSSNVSTTLENIKNVSNNVAESSKFITQNFIEKTTGTKKNVGGFIGILDTALDCWDIFKTIFKKKK